MGADTPSKHEEQVPDAPTGWVGGEVINTGGNLYAREWIHPEKELRVGYAVDDPTVVAVEKVRFEGDGEKSNPLMWQRISDIESESCDGEDDCLETALRLMQKMNEEK